MTSHYATEDIKQAQRLAGVDLTIHPNHLAAFVEILQLIEIRNAAVTPVKPEEIGGTTFTTKYKSGDATHREWRPYKGPADMMGQTVGPTPDIYETGVRCEETFCLQCVMYQHDPDVTTHRYDITSIPGEHDSLTSAEQTRRINELEQQFVEYKSRIETLAELWDAKNVTMGSREASAELGKIMRANA